MVFQAPTSVVNETVSVPVGSNINTKKVTAVNADNTMSDVSWWSPVHKNQVKENFDSSGNLVTINDPHNHIDRGYEDIVGKLTKLGADIKRV